MSKAILDVVGKFAGLIIGLFLGMLAYFLIPDPGYAPRLIAAFLTFIGTVVGVDSIKLANERLELRKSIDQLSSALSFNLETDFERSDLFPSPQQELKADQMPRIWLNLIFRFDTMFSATNFIPSDMMFDGKKYARLGREAQALKVNAGKTVRKLLIFREADKESYKNELQAQLGLGLCPKFIFYETICNDTNLRNKLDKLDSIDFGLFDSKIVLIWLLDKDSRHVIGGRILFDVDRFNQYKDFYESVYTEAEYFTSEGFTPSKGRLGVERPLPTQ